MLRPLLLLAAVAATALAGCAQTAGPGPAPPSLAARLTDGIPPIAWNVTDQVDWWQDIATNYPKHDSNLPTNAQLRERLVADLQDLGFDVEVRAYPGGAEGVGLPMVMGTELYTVIGTKPGLGAPDHRIGLVSHYDTAVTTVHGAYDDASGVAAEMSICKALAAVPMNKTLACIFFDGEERGLEASRMYVDDVVLEGDEGYVYDWVLGYDMTGINWPGHDWKMYAMVGENVVDPLFPLMQDIMHGTLGYPEEGVEVLDVHDRNSDERRFKEACVPIVRFAGGRHAADYPQYHMPLDTVDYVYDYVGGRANFEAGFATIVEASYTTALALDQTDAGSLGWSPDACS